jgi:putative alpha-1,2-mannosidase
VNGGTLEVKMDNLPNKTLGTDPADLPPSEMNFEPQSLR